MSVYKPRKSPHYYYDFWLRGRRFLGSTNRSNKRDAQEVEQQARASAEHDDRLAAQSRTAAGLTIDLAAGRYWTEVGQFHANADTTERDLARLVDYFGRDKLLNDITDDDIAQLIAWRRGQKARGLDKFVTNATVNRSTTEVVKKLFTRAKYAWRIEFAREPRWRHHWLAEPQERVRELLPEEARKIEAATPAEYAPFFAFARASGFRLRECLLRWSEVNWSTAQIVKIGKGSRRVTTPITPAIRSILLPLVGHDTETVFTYVARPAKDGKAAIRKPITYQGAKTAWRRLRAKAKVRGFRFHDFRHDLGTKLLRETGNLKIVQKALNHTDIKTTTKYAHVLDDEVAEALKRVQKLRVIEADRPRRSRKN